MNDSADDNVLSRPRTGDAAILLEALQRVRTGCLLGSSPAYMGLVADNAINRYLGLRRMPPIFNDARSKRR